MDNINSKLILKCKEKKSINKNCMTFDELKETIDEISIDPKIEKIEIYTSQPLFENLHNYVEKMQYSIKTSCGKPLQ